jgi:hypothetical protein
MYQVRKTWFTLLNIAISIEVLKPEGVVELE